MRSSTNQGGVHAGPRCRQMLGRVPVVLPAQTALRDASMCLEFRYPKGRTECGKNEELAVRARGVDEETKAEGQHEIVHGRKAENLTHGKPAGAVRSLDEFDPGAIDGDGIERERKQGRDGGASDDQKARLVVRMRLEQEGGQERERSKAEREQNKGAGGMERTDHAVKIVSFRRLECTRYARHRRIQSVEKGEIDEGRREGEGEERINRGECRWVQRAFKEEELKKVNVA